MKEKNLEDLLSSFKKGLAENVPTIISNYMMVKGSVKIIEGLRFMNPRRIAEGAGLYLGGKVIKDSSKKYSQYFSNYKKE